MDIPLYAIGWVLLIVVFAIGLHRELMHLAWYVRYRYWLWDFAKRLDFTPQSPPTPKDKLRTRMLLFQLAREADQLRQRCEQLSPDSPSVLSRGLKHSHCKLLGELHQTTRVAVKLTCFPREEQHSVYEDAIATATETRITAQSVQ